MRGLRHQNVRGAALAAVATTALLIAFASGNAGSSQRIAVGMARQQKGDRPFRHATHKTITCQRCHNTSTRHGALTITAPQDCLSCHHRQEQRLACSRCHENVGTSAAVYHVQHAFQVGAGAVARRAMPFRHQEHADIACGKCHTAPISLSARTLSCELCHAEHHNASASCVSCHTRQPEKAVHPRSVHVTCSGAGCHSAEQFVQQERTRNVCLACHQDLRNHKSDVNCINCHLLPPWRSSASSP